MTSKLTRSTIKRLLGSLFILTCLNQASAEDKRPNLLIIMTDDQGQWSLGEYDERVETPNLDHLARHGVVFNQAISPTPVCSAARASLYTGRTASQHGVHDFLSDKDASSDSVPIKPDQLIGLLDHLREEGKPEVWLMVALVGMYGLRPAELAALSVQDGRLYVGSQIKRNRSTMKRKPTSKLVMALEIDGRDDGAMALRQFESGLIKFPKGVRNAIDKGEFKKVGDSFAGYLKRLPYWTSMVAATPGLTPYGLRHGWAWRAHKYYDRPLSVRELAQKILHFTGKCYALFPKPLMEPIQFFFTCAHDSTH